MKESNNYKVCNIEWIGDIPSTWKIGALKHCFKFKVGFTPPTSNDKFYIDVDSDEGYYWVTIGDLNTKYILNSKHKITDLAVETYNKDFVPKGSLLYSFKLSVGKVAFAGKDIYTNEAIFSILPDENLELSYYYYCLPIILIHNANENIYGAKIFNQEVIKNSKLPIPPIKEQTQIANFLDYKTNLIDSIIEKKKKLIELLKEKRRAVINEAVTKGLNPNAAMKDSGVEWLGEIPEHWEVVRLKQIANAFGRIGYRGYTTEDIVGEDEGAITISPSNMKGNYMTFENCTYINWDKYEESPEIKIYNGDILMVKTGSTYGKVGIVKDLNKKATINPQLLVLKDVKINSNYLFNLLRTNYMQYQVETNVIGSTIPTISQTKILNFSLPLPPSDEIEAIMLFIQNKMDLIDKNQKSIELAIEKLQEYRQSLISEAVTGKIDVRDWSK